MELSYRDLIPGDVVQIGDQVAADRDGVWIHAFATIGLTVRPDWSGFYRRLVSATPDTLPPETEDAVAPRVEVGPVLVDRLKRLSNAIKQVETLREELRQSREIMHQVCLQNHRLTLTAEEREFFEDVASSVTTMPEPRRIISNFLKRHGGEE